MPEDEEKHETDLTKMSPAEQATYVMNQFAKRTYTHR